MGLRETLRLVTQLDPNKYGTAYGLTSLLPVQRGQEDALEAHLESLDPLASPFAALSQAHFVRLVVIRDLVYQGPPQVPEHLDRPYLAFTASLDGELDPFLRDVAALTESGEIFSRCSGYAAEPGAFSAWVRSHQKANGYLLSPWPFKRVEDVREGLRAQDGFGELVENARSLSDAELQDAFKALMRATARQEARVAGSNRPEGDSPGARSTK